MFDRIKPLVPPTIDRGVTARRDGYIQSIKNILSGADSRKLLIIGPCSADSESAVKSYVQMLLPTLKKLSEIFFPVIRVFTAKPRSRGDGYMGLIHSYRDLNDGVAAAVKLHTDIMSEYDLPTADELLYPELAPTLGGVCSYMTVGARTAEDPTHRFAASGLNVPVGIKNPINGNLSELVNSVHAARLKAKFFLGGEIVQTSGNEYAHGILRGGVDSRGNYFPLCYEASVREYTSAADGINSCVIDCSHANSGKDPSAACEVFISSAKLMKHLPTVKGLMLESYIHDGCAADDGAELGRSLTDPCLDIERTNRLLLEAGDILS